MDSAEPWINTSLISHPNVSQVLNPCSGTDVDNRTPHSAPGKETVWGAGGEVWSAGQ